MKYSYVVHWAYRNGRNSSFHKQYIERYTVRSTNRVKGTSNMHVDAFRRREQVTKWQSLSSSIYPFTAVMCSSEDLPGVTNGSFKCGDRLIVGDVCNLTCRENYYPSLLSQTTCLNVGNGVGKWSNVTELVCSGRVHNFSSFNWMERRGDNENFVSFSPWVNYTQKWDTW